ncbi:MAG: hypothetical protein D6732_12500 [Methanobacteriota archaeon]|nr:MAG: hypothetical protein D6732_12500 [Euryarchaeota archaeon]
MKTEKKNVGFYLGKQNCRTDREQRKNIQGVLSLIPFFLLWFCVLAPVCPWSDGIPGRPAPLFGVF